MAGHDLDGDYTASVSEGTGTATYGWIEWNTGDYSNPTSGTTAVLSLSNKATGSYTYQAKACLGNNGGQVCSGWSASDTIYVLRTPGNPTIDAAALVCGSLNVIWSPGSTSYPGTTHSKLYELEESTNGGSSWSAVSGRTDTTETSWTHPSPVASTAYQYRVRAWYTWNSFTSNKTGWISDSITYPVCPSPPDPPVLSEATIANTQITANWSEPAVGLRYELERRDITTNPSAAWTEIYDGPNSTYLDTGAGTVGNTYEYRARACDLAYCSAWSNTVDVELYQIVSLEYQYDALGRLTKVLKDSAVKTGYCYDQAGNRQAVTADSGGGDDCADAQPLAAPTGLSTSSHAGNGYNVYWNEVSGATHYELRIEKFNSSEPGDPYQYITVEGGDSEFYATPSWYEPIWIQACNELTGFCGPKAYY